MLDVELHRQDIQDLHNADAVAAFFAKLRYDTNARLTQKPANLGIVESLHSQIRHCERIADQENLLQLYLFELTSVTVATTKILARAFKNLSGDFLLVLTSDYERLDFVFLERMLPEVAQLPHPGHPKALRQTIQRPRVLTVERRNPDPVSLRVLRRFTYTEADPFGQVEKLKSAFSVADWSEEEFNNRALFADYYLKERLPDYAEWKEDAKPLFNTLSDLYERARERWGGKPEKVLRDECLKPTLEDLGFKLEEGKPAGDPSKKPDFVLYSPSKDSIPIAYCLAYRWDRFLDGKDAKDTETPDENPGSVVVTLLEREDVNWVIVTNGKLWRLYSSKADSIASNYYEVDLEETLATREADLFRYFWLLFRAESFVPKEQEIDGEVKTLMFLDRLIDGSADYAKRLGDKLKDLIFEEIFVHLARGFIAYQRATPGLDEVSQRKLLDVDAQPGLKPLVDQPWMDRVYQATLTFLYRLLFLLYAEARDLLPVKSQRGYFERSLTKMKREVAEKAGDEPDSAEAKIEKTYSKKPEKTELYDRFMELCRIIDEGDASIDLPMYNGGLFLMSPEADDPTPEAESARLLNELKMPDAYMAQALDLLARTVDEKTQGRVFIDYKSLGVRQLGSIYEGLLEFHLRQAKEKLAICRDSKRKAFYMPYREATKAKGVTILKEDRRRDAKERTLSRGAVYLQSTKHERKATGSYYTPEYIVKYIVEHTVGPILEEKFQNLTPALRDAEKLYHKKRKYKAEAPDLADDPEKVALMPEVRKATEELFDVKVLDPAMGSGHFLVEAVDFIADKMLHFLNGFSWTPVLAELEETKRTILEEMQNKKISIDPDRLTNVNLLKRHILKRCIYGVDLNPMAVELSKVSLWLHCFTLGAPLSFLDHHLKCGNSLIGAEVEEVRETVEAEKQLALFGSQFIGLLNATELMRRVGELSDVTAAQVRESRVEYCKAYDALGPFRRILDLYTSQWFGNGREEVLEFLGTKEAEAWVNNKSGASSKLDDDQKALVTTAQVASGKHRFLHWDLAFPEVFFGPREGTTQLIEKKDNPGFDAVVGNPPYVRQEELGAIKKDYFQPNYKVYHGVADIYVYFYERSHQVLRTGGHFSMITSNKFMRTKYGGPLRDYLIAESIIDEIIDFGELPVFEDSATFPCIILTQARTTNGKPTRLTQVKDLAFDSLNKLIDSQGFLLPSLAMEGHNWSLATGEKATILVKMKAVSIPLGDYVDGKIKYGIKTGFNEAFFIDQATHDRLIDEDPSSIEIIRPLVVGDDIRRFEIDFKERYLIWTYIGVPIKKYPAIFKYLQQFQEPLKKRWDKGKEWWELRACNYYEDFEKPKIVLPDIAKESRFAFDNENFFLGNTAYIIPVENFYLLSVLAANLTFEWYKSIAMSLGDVDKGGRLRFIYQHLVHIPIRRIHFTTPEAERKEEVKRLAMLYGGGQFEELLGTVENCLPKDADGNFLAFKERATGSEEKSDVVHDLLAHLAQQMLDLNKTKQAEQKAFLGWLEEAVGCSIDDLSGKTKLRNFMNTPPDELLQTLNKNRRKVIVAPRSGPFIKAFNERYHQAMTALEPICRKVGGIFQGQSFYPGSTDWLIDQVVYRLYGLTEEEIRIVEGTAR